MNRLPLLLFGGAVTVVVLAVYFLVNYLIERRRRHWERRMNDVDPEISGILSRGAAPDEQPGGLAGKLDARFDRMIVRTNMELTSEQALGIMALTGMVLATALYLWREQPWLSVLGFLLGMAVPFIVFWILQARHQRALQAQLPDAIYLIARSLRSGLNMEQALRMVVEQNMVPLSGEFQRCVGQVRMGLTIPAALRLMAQRIQLVDFNAFVSSVAYHHSLGGNLPSILDRLAASTRDHNLYRGQLLSATAQARATALFIGLAGPVLLLCYALFQPAHVQAFFQSPNGWTLLIGALVMELIASVILYNMLKVDY